MKEIKAPEFKARCLQLMDEVAATREPGVITKHGKPVCQVIPYKPRPETLFGISKDTVIIRGDSISPIDVEWEAGQRSCSTPMSCSGIPINGNF